MSIRLVQFIAIMLTVLALVPGGAHLMELPNKMKLSPADYMTVQGIYSGWAFAGIVLIGAIVANLWLAIRSRPQPVPFTLASCAFLLMLTTLVTFFIWIYPANVATSQWTSAPADLEPLRRQWEHTHAANALITLLAVVSVVAASLGWSER